MQNSRNFLVEIQSYKVTDFAKKAGAIRDDESFAKKLRGNRDGLAAAKNLRGIKNYLVPTVVEKTYDGERAFDIYSRLLKERIVFIGEEINETVANLVIAQLLFLDSEDSKADINLYINSNGGSVYDGFAILDTMNLVRCDVATYGVGLQASMAAVLLANGAKGKRFMLPHAKAMIHQPSAGTRGKVTDMEIDLRETLAVKDESIRIMAAATGQAEKKIREDMERDFWMTAEEARKYGLIDEIVAKGRK